MSVVDNFRLTKLLHDQVEGSGDRVDKVLRSWDEKDYKNLCDYVMQCKGVVPKYVGRLAKLMGIASGDVITEIIGAQDAQSAKGRKATDSDNESSCSNGYLPEDTVERSAFVQSIVKGQESGLSL